MRTHRASGVGQGRECTRLLQYAALWSCERSVETPSSRRAQGACCDRCSRCGPMHPRVSGQCFGRGRFPSEGLSRSEASSPPRCGPSARGARAADRARRERRLGREPRADRSALVKATGGGGGARRSGEGRHAAVFSAELLAQGKQVDVAGRNPAPVLRRAERSRKSVTRWWDNNRNANLLVKDLFGLQPLKYLFCKSRLSMRRRLENGPRSLRKRCPWPVRTL